jgi:hypothetical protein
MTQVPCSSVDFLIQISTAPGTGASRSFALQEVDPTDYASFLGSPSPLCTISESDTSCGGTASVTLLEKAAIALKNTESSGPAAAKARWYIRCAANLLPD